MRHPIDMSPFTSDRFKAVADDHALRHAFMEDFTAASVAVQLRALREDRGLTQIEMENRSGIAQATISDCETAERCRHVSVSTLLTFARFFDVALIIRFVGWPEFVALLPDGRVIEAPKAFADDVLHNPDEST